MAATLTGAVPLPTNAAQEAGGNLAAAAASLAGIDAKLPALGPEDKAHSLSVTFATDIPPLAVNVGSTVDRSASGNITSTQELKLDTAACGTAAFQLSGTWVGICYFRFTDDGTTWHALTVDPTGGGPAVTSAAANGNWTAPVSAHAQVGIFGAVVSGTAAAFITASTATSTVSLVSSIPAGTAHIGEVSISASVLPDGAATEAEQLLGNASLSSLDSKTPALEGGRAPVASTSAAASQVDGHSATLGSTGDASSANTVVGLLKAAKAYLAGTLATSSASGSQADGHSATLGATTDTSVTNSVIGLLKRALSVLPSALTGSGNLRVAVAESSASQAVTGDFATEATLAAQLDAKTSTLATSALQGAGLPAALTGSGNLKVALQEALPAGSATLGTVNLGTTAGGAGQLALNATLTGGTAKTQLYDGTDVLGTSAHPVRTDPTGTSTQPTSSAAASQADGHSANVGSLADAASASTLTGLLKNIKAALAGSLTVIQGTATNLLATVTLTSAQVGSAGAPSAVVLSVQGVASGTAQPASNALGAQVDGHSANIGALADSTSANTLTGLLKNIKAALAGSLTIVQSTASSLLATVTLTAAQVGTAGSPSTSVLSVQGVASGTAQPTSSASASQLDGHSANIGALADASSASTLTGLLKNIKAALAGTLTVLAPSGTWTWSTVASSASSGTLIASNASRRGLCVSNNSTSILYLYMSSSTATMTTANNVIIPPGGDYVMPSPIYTGQITCIWSAANGSAQVTELT